MSRDNASLLDIANAAKRVLKFAEGLDKSTLAANEEKQSAILYQVIVIGEATRATITRISGTTPGNSLERSCRNARSSCSSI